jgi:hypothetical protein
MGAYPGGELSGPPTHFVGLKFRFAPPPKRSPVE